MDAVLLQEFDVSKISYGFLKRQSQGIVVSVHYNDSILTLQTPLMNTFGISEMGGKWSLTLIFNEANGVKNSDLCLFKDVLNRLREKIVSDIVEKKLYKEWMGIHQKWNTHSDTLKRELVCQKIGSEFLKHSKRDVEKKYPPTMSLKINRNKDTNEPDLSIFKVSDSNEFVSDEFGEPLDFKSDALNLLDFQGQDSKTRPKIYCLVTFNIWYMYGKLYITPSCNAVCLTPVKIYNSRARFNIRGFTHSSDPYEEPLSEKETMDFAASYYSSPTPPKPDSPRKEAGDKRQTFFGREETKPHPKFQSYQMQQPDEQDFQDQEDEMPVRFRRGQSCFMLKQGTDCDHDNPQETNTPVQYASENVSFFVQEYNL